MIIRFDHRSMHFRLILLIFQVSSVGWLWHESKEQIQFLVEAQLPKRNMDSHVKREVHEAVASLAVPSLVMITLTLLLCYQLQRELESRSEDNRLPQPDP